MKACLLTVFGLGTLPRAPGTWGSLPVPILFLLLMFLWGGWTANVVLLLLLLLASAVTVVLGPWAEAKWGKEDPQVVVSDEVAGQCVVFLMLPWNTPQVVEEAIPVVITAVVGFILFRVFDIMKPPPIQLLQDLPGGWGILTDDLAAGVYAGIVTWCVAWGMGLAI